MKVRYLEFFEVVLTGFLAMSATGCSDDAQSTGDVRHESPAEGEESGSGDPADSGGSGDSNSPDPGPDGGTGPCALPNYPNAGCTGVPPGTALTMVEEDMTIREPNTVIDGKEIHGCLRIEAPGVVIRRSKISCSSFLAIGSYKDAYTGTGVLIEDSEIDCNKTQGTAIGDTNVTARRLDIHDCENGFDVDGELIVEDSYIHDMIPYDEVKDPHVDGLQITHVGHDVVIRHNTIYVPGATSAIISPRISSGVVSNILIEDNLVAGGAYTIYCPADGKADNFRVINNHFSTKYSAKVGAYGPWTECEDEAEVSGNVYHENGKPL